MFIYVIYDYLFICSVLVEDDQNIVYVSFVIYCFPTFQIINKVNLAHIFTCLIAYLFAFYIYSPYLFVHIPKKYLSIADMLPHYRIPYKDIILLSVFI
jgi:hypothetical protein